MNLLPMPSTVQWTFPNRNELSIIPYKSFCKKLHSSHFFYIVKNTNQQRSISCCDDNFLLDNAHTPIYSIIIFWFIYYLDINIFVRCVYIYKYVFELDWITGYSRYYIRMEKLSIYAVYIYHRITTSQAQNLTSLNSFWSKLWSVRTKQHAYDIFETLFYTLIRNNNKNVMKLAHCALRMNVSFLAFYFIW